MCSKSAEPGWILDTKRGLAAAIWCRPTDFLLTGSNPGCPCHTPSAGWCCLCTNVNHMLQMSAQLWQLSPTPPTANPVHHSCLLSPGREPPQNPGAESMTCFPLYTSLCPFSLRSLHGRAICPISHGSTKLTVHVLQCPWQPFLQGAILTISNPLLMLTSGNRASPSTKMQLGRVSHKKANVLNIPFHREGGHTE